MGNPSILGPRGADLRPPDELELQWNVYLLRDEGYKLDPEEVRRTHRLGRIVIRTDDVPTAHVEDRSGKEVGTLRHV